MAWSIQRNGSAYSEKTFATTMCLTMHYASTAYAIVFQNIDDLICNVQQTDHTSGAHYWSIHIACQGIMMYSQIYSL